MSKAFIALIIFLCAPLSSFATLSDEVDGSTSANVNGPTRVADDAANQYHGCMAGCAGQGGGWGPCHGTCKGFLPTGHPILRQLGDVCQGSSGKKLLVCSKDQSAKLGGATKTADAAANQYHGCMAGCASVGGGWDPCHGTCKGFLPTGHELLRLGDTCAGLKDKQLYICSKDEVGKNQKAKSAQIPDADAGAPTSR